MLKALHPSYKNASYNKITKKRYTKPSIIAIKATILYGAASRRK
jgi:hypothetical protein